MMEKIVVLSHEADMSADDLQTQIKTLTGTEFGIKTVDKKNTIDYGSVKTTTIEKQSENAICLCVGKGDGWKLTVNSTDVELKVEALTYDKRLYRPGQLDIRLSCTGSKDDIKLVEELKNQLCKYVNEVPVRSSIYFLGNTDSDLIDVCNNYYAHDFSISNEDNNGTIVTKITLHCYSPDKLLTLDKYSKVYCGEGFDTKLFKEMEKQPNNLKLNYETKSLLRVRKAKRYFKREDPLYQIMQTLDKESQQYIILKEEVDKKKDGALEYTPVRFPYLVQYNESFYDFLRRIAVRCGEFLYYENGALTLGIASEKQKRPDKVLDSTKFHIQFPKVNISNAQDPNIKLYTNSAFVPSTEEEKQTHKVNGDKTYNMEYTNDDFVKYLDSHDNDAIYDSLYAWEKFTYGSLGAALTKATSAETAASVIATAYLSSIADAGINKEKLEDELEDYHYKYNNMMGLYNSSMLTNKFYYNVEMQEKVAQDGTIKLNYSSNIPQLYLCDPVDLDIDKECYYYVSHIHGSIEPKTIIQNEKETITYSRENYAEIIPTLQREDEEIIYTDETKETIDVYTIVPPHYDIPRIRKADPQEAIVKQVDDPRLMGRVRVLYRWQKEEAKEIEKSDGTKYKSYNYSPWLKVTVPYSGGNQGGMNMMPEIGDHVMVNFVGGNVDNPYIEGYLFYEISRPPMGAGMIKNKLTAGFQRKVISSSKGHAITFTDISDKSSILNMVCPPAAAIANMVQGIGKQFAGWTDPLPIDTNCAPFTGGITLRDPNGVYELDLSAKTRSINVKSPFGNVNISAFTGITIDAPNGDVKIRGKNVSIEAGNNLTLTSGTNIRNAKADKKSVSTSVGIAAITSTVSVGETALGAYAPWTKEFAKLADMSFLRCSWEVIVRPVEGSLKLQSKRNTIMTAGNGKVAVPKNTISDAVVLNHGKFVKLNEELDFVTIFVSVQSQHNLTFAEYKNHLSALNSKIVSIREKLVEDRDHYCSAFYDEFFLFGNIEVDCYVAIFNKIKNNEKISEWSKACMYIKDYWEGNEDLKDDIEKHNKCIQELNEAKIIYKTILNGKKAYVELMKKLLKRYNKANESISSGFLDSLWDVNTLFDINYEEDECFILRNIDDRSLRSQREKGKKKLLYYLIESGFKGKFVSVDDEGHAIEYDTEFVEGWDNYVSHLRFASKKAKPNPFGAMVDNLTLGMTNFSQFGFGIDALLNGNYGKLFNYHGIAGPRSIWGTAQKGQILVSNNPSNTMLLDDLSKSWITYPSPDMAAIQAALGYVPPQNPQQNAQDNQNGGN